MTDLTHPRTLVISTTRFSAVTATGSALVSLFGDWPSDGLAQIHHQGGTVETDVCTKYHHFQESDVSADGALSAKLLSFVRDFAPDVIYYRTIDGPPGFRRLALAISSATDTPIVTHTMDDWLTRMEANASTPSEQRDAAVAGDELRTLIGAAAANLTISDKMGRAMTSQYGSSFITFHNAIDLAEWTTISRQRSVETDGVFRIRYTGSLADDMSLQSAKDFGHVVDVLSSEGRSIALEFSSAPWWQQVFNDEISHYRSTSHAGFLSRADYLQFLADADLAIIPINFDDHSLGYIQYSMSNKAPEYMAAKIPVLVYGPSESATIEYAASAGWAHAVTEHSANELGIAIRTLMDNAPMRSALAESAHDIGMAAHNAVDNRQRFVETLQQAAR